MRADSSATKRHNEASRRAALASQSASDEINAQVCMIATKALLRTD
jgi:hypothetical protein